MTDNMNMANLLQGVDPTQLKGLLGGLGNIQAIKSPDKMYYCKIPQKDGTKCWGFLSPYDDRLAEATDKVEVTITEHQKLISGGQIVYYDGKLFNSDRYKLDENYDFIPNDNYEEEQTAARQATFESQFFQIAPMTAEVADTKDPEKTVTVTIFPGGWYRKVPKGYSSAVESLNTAFINVLSLNKLPAGTLIFYTAPDFTKPEECTEEWLVAHQFRNIEMTKEQFIQFHSVFTTAWNATEH